MDLGLGLFIYLWVHDPFSQNEGVDCYNVANKSSQISFVTAETCTLLAYGRDLTLLLKQSPRITVKELKIAWNRYKMPERCLNC